jgi:hypothetical protein
MGWESEIADVVTGEPVESEWGNQIRDQIVHVIPTAAGLPSDAADGAVCYAQDTDKLYLRRVGAWIVQGGGAGVLGYAQVTTAQTVGTTPTVLTGLTLTVTVPASRRIKVTGKMIVSPNAGAVIAPSIYADAVEVQKSTTVLQTGEFMGVHLEVVLTPTAGNHTYDLRLSTNSGQVSNQAAATFPSFILVEDLGPA